MRWLLWSWVAVFPLPFVANSLGWMTAELGRQPWLIYGLMRTDAGSSPSVPAAAGIFSLVGFALIYALLTVLFVFLVSREIQHGPSQGDRHAA
jgi:cytochrome d ubiquinol oxidase subunit I